jgi:two-component system, chemotaxis family, protein-glutamate methylesterase/glutaminase
MDKPLNVSQMQSSTPVRVLVVDDSAFMRYTISQRLGEDPAIQVIGSARNGEEALTQVHTLQPDVVTMDVEMPGLDGLSALKEIMATSPRPVIMLSSLTQDGAVETVRALTLGAIDFVAKPTQKSNIGAVMDELARKITHAAKMRVRTIPVLGESNPNPVRPSVEKAIHPLRRNQRVVVIGSSTGGPRALAEVIPGLPQDLPAAVVVVQHMPAGFTHSLAERLDSLSPLKVREARPGDCLMAGQVLVAPGGFHMVIDERGQVTLNQNPPVHGVRPAVDVTLASVVKQYGRNTIAVILTGMGSDGTNGSTLTHNCGGWVIAEHESTTVVYGMPRSVVEAGAADQIVPLPKVASAIHLAVCQPPDNPKPE